jgi:hypothetical protein
MCLCVCVCVHNVHQSHLKNNGRAKYVTDLFLYFHGINWTSTERENYYAEGLQAFLQIIVQSYLYALIKYVGLQTW